ncbi:MAG: type II secretion system F family protein [Ahrensia sp.]|nr:type II secretion system F family protein [Ahrensia sp.]
MDFLTTLLQAEHLVAGATSIAVFATILTLIIPFFSKDRLSSRMKSVALEREKLRANERQRLKDDKIKGRGRASRREPGALLKTVVDGLNLRTALADEKTEETLVQAGFRGPAPLFVFLGLRLLLPFVLGGLCALYIFVLVPIEADNLRKLLFCIVAGGLGFYLPVLYLNNRLKSRQLSITQAWPDALDLTLICVESGMSIEAAFRKVATEIGSQSIALAEELSLTTAELSFLSERRKAYENLTKRTGLESVKNVTLSLIQAEKYGTPLADALRVLSQENRDMRMNLAEKKAAALPPKLTVPMMLCFLPVLFCVILAPAVIRTLDIFGSSNL